MSLILKGIDLPKEGEYYNTIIQPNGKVLVDIVREGNILEDCLWGKAILIPKDARLIDANKLEIHKISNHPILRDFAYVYAGDIEYASAILGGERMTVEVGKYYKPNPLSSWEDFCIVKVYQIGMGRVCFTDIESREDSMCDLGEFKYYYAPATEEEVNRAKGRSKK